MNHQIEDFTLVQLIGKGRFSEVYLSKKNGSNKLWAIKRINRNVEEEMKKYNYLEGNINNLVILNHPKIVKYEKRIVTQNSCYIVMEYINGGKLSDCLLKYRQKYQENFPEEIIQYLMKQIVEGVIYLHDNYIIHRDLRLENIMVNFDSENDNKDINMLRAKIKIIDFGSSIQLSTNNILTNTLAGFSQYTDPKILECYLNHSNLKYGTESDIWSLGCICYELLMGKPPYEGNNLSDLIIRAKKGQYYLSKPLLSKEIDSFLNSMLQYEGANRLSARNLFQESFLTKKPFNFFYIKKNKEDLSRVKDSLTISDIISEWNKNKSGLNYIGQSKNNQKVLQYSHYEQYNPFPKSSSHQISNNQFKSNIAKSYNPKLKQYYSKGIGSTNFKYLLSKIENNIY